MNSKSTWQPSSHLESGKANRARLFRTRCCIRNWIVAMAGSGKLGRLRRYTAHSDVQIILVVAFVVNGLVP